jgi:hypothetical protein
MPVKKIPADEITSRYPDSTHLNTEYGQQTSDFFLLHTGQAETKKPQQTVFSPTGRMLFCATNSVNSKTPLALRGGTSFELAVSSNCIELPFLKK